MVLGSKIHIHKHVTLIMTSELVDQIKQFEAFDTCGLLSTKPKQFFYYYAVLLHMIMTIGAFLVYKCKHRPEDKGIFL